MRRNWTRRVPHVVTALRACSAPLLWWLIVNVQADRALILLVLAMISDAVDGPLTRRIGTPSAAGAYFDATADCAVIVAAFSGFAAVGIYPAWTVVLILLVFAAFIFTSRFTAGIYDPVGRHIGGILFVCIGATLVLPDFFFEGVILAIVTGALLVTFAARMGYAFQMIADEPSDIAA